jgi:hypothetical protein
MSRYDTLPLYTCDRCGRSEDGTSIDLPRDWTEVIVRIQEVIPFRGPISGKNFITHRRHICYECTGANILELRVERGRIEECDVTVLLGGNED